MTIYRYARLSTIGQTLASQRALLKGAGVTRILSEKVSGVAALMLCRDWVRPPAARPAPSRRLAQSQDQVPS